MQFKTIVSTLRDNHIPMNSKFEKAPENGCIGDYQELFDRVIADIERYVVFGVNHGFNGALKKTIQELTDQLVVIGKQSDAKKIKKITAEVDKITKLTDVHLPSDQVEGDTQMKDEVIKRIDAYIQGANVLLSRNNASDRHPILQQSIVKLMELKMSLAEVTDCTSEQALGHAKKIVEGLKAWAEKAAHSMHTEATLSFLDAALNASKNWSKEHMATGRGFFGGKKVAKNTDEICFEADEMAHIAQSKSHVNDIEMFLANVKDYRADVEMRFDTKPMEERLATQNARLEAKKKEKADLQAALRNGEISQKAFLDRVKDLNYDIGDYEEMVQDTRERIDIQHQNSELHFNTLDTLDDLGRMLRSYSNDAEMLDIIFEYVDFNALDNIMRGRADANDNAVVRTITKVKELLEKQAMGKMEDLRDGMRADRDRVRAERQAAREERAAARAEREARRNPRAQAVADDGLTDEERAELAAALGEMPAEPQPVAEERPTVKNSNLEISDLL